MAGISSLGSGSGMDLSGLIDKLMAAEKAPLKDLLLKEASYQAKISAYGSVKSALSAFQASLKTFLVYKRSEVQRRHWLILQLQPLLPIALLSPARIVWKFHN